LSEVRELLIRRSWHDVLENRIKEWRLPEADSTIPGVWANDARGEHWPKQVWPAAAKAYGH